MFVVIPTAGMAAAWAGIEFRVRRCAARMRSHETHSAFRGATLERFINISGLIISAIIGAFERQTLCRNVRYIFCFATRTTVTET